MLTTILFDLDGTLAPFFQDDFIKSYFSTLVRHMTPLGFDGEKLSGAIWKGTMAMVANDGAVTNRQLFWDLFTRELGIQALSLESHLEDFYLHDFDSVRAVLRENVDRGELIDGLRAKGYSLVLATTPIFPLTAIQTRLAWVGLVAEDFDLVTTYENCRHSKPNVDYYRDILRTIGAEAPNCLMIGNNPVEDMAALQTGMSAFLVTDYIENPGDHPIDPYPHGAFRELETVLAKLPNISGK